MARWYTVWALRFCRGLCVHHQIIYDDQPHADRGIAAITLLVWKKRSESGLSLEFVEEVLVLAKVVPKMPGGVQLEKFLSHPVARICLRIVEPDVQL